MFSTPALMLAVAGLAPLMLWTAWSDLKHLRIPNPAVLSVLALGLAVSFWDLTWDVALWRVGHAAIALFIGFVLHQLGILSAGDAKMIAALTPFFGGGDATSVLLTYALVSLGFLMVFVLIRHYTRQRTTGWASLDSREARVFAPFGVILAATVLIYFGALLLGRLSS